MATNPEITMVTDTEKKTPHNWVVFSFTETVIPPSNDNSGLDFKHDGTEANLVSHHEASHDVSLQSLSIKEQPNNVEDGSNDIMSCPWCHREHWKDKHSCNYIFACGLTDTGFYVGYCGRAFCFQCGKKFCSQQYDPLTGERLPTYRDPHTNECCKQEIGFIQSEYCPGGHNSHCEKRW